MSSSFLTFLCHIFRIQGYFEISMMAKASTSGDGLDLCERSSDRAWLPNFIHSFLQEAREVPSLAQELAKQGGPFRKEHECYSLACANHGVNLIIPRSLWCQSDLRYNGSQCVPGARSRTQHHCLKVSERFPSPALGASFPCFTVRRGGE